MYIGKAPTHSKSVRPFRVDWFDVCNKIQALKPGQALIFPRSESKYSPVTFKCYLAVALQARNIKADVYTDWKARPEILTYIYKEPKS